MRENDQERKLKVAIVHNWLWNMRGAEKCLDTILQIYPDADLYALFGDVSVTSPIAERIKYRKVTFSWLNRLPWIRKIYRATFPFWAVAVEGWDFSKYDLVISSSASTVKGVITPMDTMHICYMYSPMRYIWDQQRIYLSKRGWFTRKLFALFAHYMRIWDVTSTPRIDHLVSISEFVSTRIRKYYRVDPDAVIYPPVDIDMLMKFRTKFQDKEDYYVMVSGFQENKGASEAIQYAKSSGQELVLVGDGPKRRSLERNSRTHRNIKFTGWISDEELSQKVARAKGLLFLGVEDFGLVPVEAAALGTPVVAYGRGGSLESVKPGITGVFVEKVDVESLAKGIEEAEDTDWDRDEMERFAKEFSTERFMKEFESFVKGVLS